ncbi:MAG: hypothetical protein GOU98_00140 [Candidatus Altiarchaeota archaeon]|nr:hypothetical protein [Candidatus Altiarchaeota archaeon]
MRYLVLALLLIPTFGAQINPWVGGVPTGIQTHDDYYIISTSNTLYIFDTLGLVDQLNLAGISDFSIIDEILVVTLVTQDFPNIRAYSFPNLEPLWNFEPTIDVFDMALIWDKKQTRSWRVKPVGDGFGVASGYSFYFFSKTGEIYANFTAESDIWDFAQGDQKYYLATQEGAVYFLDSDLNFVKKEVLCEPYILFDEISNRTEGEYPRSIWFISENAAVCEDGFIHFFNQNRKFEVKEFTASQLRSVYKEAKRESGYGSPFFQNLKLKTFEDYDVAYASDGIMVFKNGVPAFDLSETVSDVDISGGKLYTLSISRSGLETTKIYNLDGGTLIKTIETKGLDCSGQNYKIFGGDLVVIAGSCETKLVDSKTSKTLWYLPTSSKVGSISDEIRVFFTDNERSQQNRPSFYSMIGYEAGVLWTYSLSDDLARNGSLTDIKVLGDTAVALYNHDDDFDGLVVVNKDGTSYFRNGTSRSYIGDFDEYLKNATILAQVENYSYEVLDQIPYEVKYSTGYDINDYEPLSVLYWTNILSALPMPVELMEQIKNSGNNIDDLRISSRLNSFSSCDYDSDGTNDLLVVGDSYFTILSGKNLTELIFKDQQAHRYSSNQTEKYTAPWYSGGGYVLCLDDFSGDGVGEFIFGTWSGNLSVITDKVLWSAEYKNLQSDQLRIIEDVDGDGINDILAQKWVQDKPNDVFFLSTVNGRQRAIFSAYNIFYDTNSADVDGDGKNENFLIYSSEESFLSVFSPTYKFEYSGIRDSWNTWSEYGKVLPVEIIPDYDDDNHNDILIGASRKWGEPANILMVYSGATKNLIETIYLDGKQGRDLDENEWQYFPEIQRFGDLLTLVIPGQEGGGGRMSEGRFGVYNLTSREMVAYFNHDVKSAVSYGDEIILLGKGGEIFILNQVDFLKPSVSSKGASVSVQSSEDYYTMIYVDGGIAGSGRKTQFSMRLPNGDHEVIVSLLDEDGFEKLFSYEVDTFTSTSLSFLNNTLIAILILFGGFKVFKKWKSQ